MSAYPTRDDASELASFAFVAQPWADRAVCAQADPEAWFPAKGRANRYAKAVCAHCPVRQRCLDWAMATDQRFGVWGGLSTRERDRMKWAATRQLSTAMKSGCDVSAGRIETGETASDLTPKPPLSTPSVYWKEAVDS